LQSGRYGSERDFVAQFVLPRMKEAARVQGVADILDFHVDVAVDGGVADLFATRAGRRLFVVEAKFKKKIGRIERDIEPRDPEVIDQALRYANYGGFPFYLTCNTKRIILFKLQPGKTPLESEVVAIEYESSPKWAEYVLKLTLGQIPIRPKAIDETLVDTLREAFGDLYPEFLNSLGDRLHDRSFKAKYTEWLEDQGLQFNDETNRLIAEQSGYLQLNKLLFYQVIRTVYPDRLAPLEVREEEDVADALERFYRQAKKIDYAPVYESDVISEIPLSRRAKERIRTLIDTLGSFDFSGMQSDFLGRVYEKLIPTAERKRLGQFYTPPGIVDFITALSIDKPDAIVLDPGCGSGSFLVRAYHKLKELNGFPNNMSGALAEEYHKQLLRQIFGIDINQFPAHLSVINLAIQNPKARIDHVNVVVKDFFDIRAGQATLSGFESITTEGAPLTIDFPSAFDVVIANPPYIRQEFLGEKEKAKIAKLVQREFSSKVFVGTPAKKPARAIVLDKASDIYVYFFIHGLGLLDDGGKLGFISSNKWFEVGYGEALQEFLLTYCKIKYIVEFDKAIFPDAEVNTAVTLLEKEPDEDKRRNNTVKFVFVKKPIEQKTMLDAIRTSKESYENEELKINIVTQSQLIPGKWIAYLRAPAVYFSLLKNPKLKRFDQIAEIYYGLKTGYDPYFVLDKSAIAQWKIERKYLKPCAPAGKSLRGVIIQPEDISQYFLIVHEPKNKLRDTNVLKYIQHGEGIDAEPSKRRTKPVPLPEVETIKGRNLWYELPDLPNPSIIFPMWFRYQYRPLVNDAKVQAQDFYYYIVVDEKEKYTLASLLYTTLTQFFLELTGRQYSGMLHTKVYELKQIPMVDLTQLDNSTKAKLGTLFKALNRVKIKQKDARLKLETVRSKRKEQTGLFEKEAREYYENLQGEERQLINEMDEIVYDFLELSNKDRITIKASLDNLREMRRLVTRGLREEEEE
jgi:type I restriction-modification system DNA methylase subunit